MAVVNITVENDHDFYRGFFYMTVGGAPVDLTGASFVMMLRRHAKDAVAYLELATESGEIVIVDPPGGNFTIRITQQQLEELATGSYDQSLIMKLQGVKQQLWSGTIVINPGPSR